MSTAVLRQDPRFHTLRKYKSTYMKRGFTHDEARLIYKHLILETTEDVGGTLAVDSYGGAVNRPEFADLTSIPQRASVLKLQFQFQSYWKEALPGRGAPEVDARLLHRPLLLPRRRPRPQGNPLPQSAVRRLLHQLPRRRHARLPFWAQLYYGEQGLYPFLQGVKRRLTIPTTSFTTPCPFAPEKPACVRFEFAVWSFAI